MKSYKVGDKIYCPRWATSIEIEAVFENRLDMLAAGYRESSRVYDDPDWVCLCRTFDYEDRGRTSWCRVACAVARRD